MLCIIIISIIQIAMRITIVMIKIRDDDIIYQYFVSSNRKYDFMLILRTTRSYTLCIYTIIFHLSIMS